MSKLKAQNQIEACEALLPGILEKYPKHLPTKLLELAVLKNHPKKSQKDTGNH
eukprot:TRINITY_DN9320_c0_g1_i1.p1 TRINITY_DN9320_c0_g1~~TRINITY_DN9320_c0_g1_i1.p1  ORF type:complete len:53 (+),score=10.15 TRINITY_DN9320_c0_g1_i1:559-717(+)